MHLNGDKWYTYMGYKNEPGQKFEGGGDVADPNDLSGAGGSANFMNFIDAVRADDFQLLNADVLEGHRSTMLCHLANISYRVGAEVEFDDSTERFIGNERANGLLSRRYRHPYFIPEVV